VKSTGRLLAIGIGAMTYATCLPAHATDISGAGSTFVFPVLTKWADTYKRATGVAINYQSVGSGAGIKQIKSKTVDFGASDAPLVPKELAASGLVQFPIVMGGVVPVINIKGVGAGQLKLTGPVLADIFLGKITRWNDPAVMTLNPNLNLPALAIVPVYRSDGSGTTYVLADYLAKVSPEWKDKVGVNTAVEFPKGIGGKGSEGVAAFIASTGGAIGYIEYAYAKLNNLAFVLLQNRDGAFVPPGSQSFQSAAAHADWASETAFYVLLANQPGSQSWPISGSTFVLVYKTQSKPGVARELMKFFDWAYHDGAKLAEDLDYVPMPQSVVQLVESAWTVDQGAGRRSGVEGRHRAPALNPQNVRRIDDMPVLVPHCGASLAIGRRGCRNG
jgi:phosphate transport system substrate-binding protein